MPPRGRPILSRRALSLAVIAIGDEAPSGAAPGTDLTDIGSPGSETVPTHNPEWTNYNVSDPGGVDAPESEIDSLDSEPAAEQEGNKGGNPETTWKVEEGEK